jgi:uncharacterized membrane protein YwaF
MYQRLPANYLFVSVKPVGKRIRMHGTKKIPAFFMIFSTVSEVSEVWPDIFEKTSGINR